MEKIVLILLACPLLWWAARKLLRRKRGRGRARRYIAQIRSFESEWYGMWCRHGKGLVYDTFVSYLDSYDAFCKEDPAGTARLQEEMCLLLRGIARDCEKKGLEMPFVTLWTSIPYEERL